MKQSKKIISLVITLAMLISAVSVLGLIPASAASGDSFALNHTKTSWEYFGSKVEKSNETSFHVKSGANSDNSFGERGIVLANLMKATDESEKTLANGFIKTDTNYRIEFDMTTWNPFKNYYIQIRVGADVWTQYSGFNMVFNTAALITPHATLISGDGSNASWKYHMSFDAYVPADLFTSDKNAHFQISVCGKSGGATVETWGVKNIAVTELYSYTVKDSNGETLGTVYGLPGDSAATIFDNSGINSDNLAYTSITPATIADNTTEITVTYDTVKTLDVYNQDSQKIGTVSAQNGDDVYTLIENSEYNYEHSRFTVSPATVAADTTSITVTYEYSYLHDVYDNEGKKLGSVRAYTGDSCYEILADTEFDKEDFAFEVVPEIIEDDTCDLIITYTLNLVDVQNIDFSGSYAGGNRTWHYIGSKVTYTGGSIQFNNNKGQSFCDRAVLLANDWKNSGLKAGKTYRLAFDMSVFPYYAKFDELTAEIHFAATAGDNGLVAGSTIKLTGEQLVNSATAYTPKDNGSVKFRVEFNITLPETGWATSGWEAGYRNIALSFYGGEVWLDNVVISTLAEIPLVDENGDSLGSVFAKPGDTVERFLPDTLFSEEYNVNITVNPETVENIDTPIVVTRTSTDIATVTVKSYDGSVVATAQGYAGNTIGDVFSETSNVKFVGITDKFGYKDATIRSNKYISRGDVNADFNLDSLDLGSLRKYILGTDVTVDTFGANVNATTLEDSEIDILDLISLKKKLANPVNELAFLTQDNYSLAWSYDFDDASVDGDYIDSQWGANHNYDDIEPATAGEKQCSYVKDGCLVLAPNDNYGAGKPHVCDAYTTKTTMNFTYGYLEVSAKLPFSSANTPAIWLKSVGDDGHLFEIDLVETFGSTSSISTNIHYWEGDTDHNLNNVDGRSFAIDNTEDFHKYGFEWYKENGVSKISFYVDGNLVKTVDASMLNCGNIDFNDSMYLIIENVPVTQSHYDSISDWATNATVATHEDYPMNAYFDYIKLYQSANQADSALWTALD